MSVLYAYAAPALRNYEIEPRGFETDCWIWQGVARSGKALARIDGKYVLVHRELWTLFYGAPAGVLMRQCPEVRCVNPAHYRPSRRELGMPLREPSTPADYRRWNLRKYGITPEEYDALLAEQGFVCAVCRKAERDKLGRSLHVDHDHLTGKVRGILCGRCNVTLGHARDDIERLRALVAYLERSASSQ